MDSKHETSFNKFSVMFVFTGLFKKFFTHTSLQTYIANVIMKGVLEFFKNLDATPTVLFVRSITWHKFHTEEPHKSGATIQKLVTIATWDPGIVHPCTTSISISACFVTDINIVFSLLFNLSINRNVHSLGSKHCSILPALVTFLQ